MTDEQARRCFLTLKEIAHNYQTRNQMRKDAAAQGLSYQEYLEMVVDNMEADAKQAVKGVRL